MRRILDKGEFVRLLTIAKELTRKHRSPEKPTDRMRSRQTCSSSLKTGRIGLHPQRRVYLYDLHVPMYAMFQSKQAAAALAWAVTAVLNTLAYRVIKQLKTANLNIKLGTRCAACTPQAWGCCRSTASITTQQPCS